MLIDHGPQKTVMTVGKSGLMWKLDRVTGKFLDVKETVFQNVWASIDMKTGRTTYRDDILEKKPGQAVASCPSPSGGHNWQVDELRSVQRSAADPAQPELRDVRRRVRSCFTRCREPTATWDACRPTKPTPCGRSGVFNSARPFLTGVISTAGGVGFVGDFNRVFRAFDVKTGKTLWETRLPTTAQGYPVTFSVGGEQFVAVPTGYNGGSPEGKPTTMLRGEIQRPTIGHGVYVFGLPKRTVESVDREEDRMRTKQMNDTTKIRSVSDGSAWGWGPMRIKKSLTVLMAVLSFAPLAAAEKYQVYLSAMPFNDATQPLMTGKGTATATLDGDTLSISGSFAGLTGPATKARLSLSRGPGIPGDPWLI